MNTVSFPISKVLEECNLFASQRNSWLFAVSCSVLKCLEVTVFNLPDMKQHQFNVLISYKFKIHLASGQSVVLEGPCK